MLAKSYREFGNSTLFWPLTASAPENSFCHPLKFGVSFLQYFQKLHELVRIIIRNHNCCVRCLKPSVLFVLTVSPWLTIGVFDFWYFEPWSLNCFCSKVFRSLTSKTHTSIISRSTECRVRSLKSLCNSRFRPVRRRWPWRYPPSPSVE